MKIARLMVLVAGAVLSVTSCSVPKEGAVPAVAQVDSTLPDFVQYANPMCGTGDYAADWGDNDCFPGAVMPFGMIQWSPDSGAGTKPGGYDYSDSQISGFSLDHLSG